MNHVSPLFRRLIHRCPWQMLFLAAAFFVFCKPVSAHDAPQVLIINSYHPGYNWSDGEMRGVLSELMQEHPSPLPAIEYLDWKNFPTPQNERQSVERLKAKYGGTKLRLVVTLDDEALNVVLANRDDLFGRDVPVVFGGVNFFTPETTRGQTNITGVSESKDYSGTLDLILRLQPNVKQIVVFHDSTESSLANRQAFDAAIPAYTNRLKFQFLENWNVDELYDALSRLPPDTAVIGLGDTRDRTGRQLAGDMDYHRTIIRKCSVPIYIVSEPNQPPFSAGNLESAVWSGIGGCMVSADKHGELVGKMANEILAGKPADSIPIVTNTPTRLAVDWKQMQRFKLPLAALPEGAEIFHEPQSFYRVNKSKIIAGSIVLLTLSGTVLVLAMNIVLRRRAERQNRELAAAAEQASELIVMLDAAGVVQYINPAVMRITGHNIEEIRRQPVLLQSALGLTDGFKPIMETLKTKPTWAERLECPNSSGLPLRLSLAASAVDDDKGNVTGYILMGRDVTREARLEEQVRTAQKMEAVGVLAGGVAHDFNNLLQIIGGHTHLAINANTSDTERRECLEQVLKASDRAAQLTRQLLAFGRRQPLQMKDTDLNDLMNQLLKMIRRVIGEQIEVEFISCRAPGNAYGDRGQLEQVFVNLCMNARDAMPAGGRLTIVMDNVTFDSAFCETHPWSRPGRYVQINLTDTGSGMDKETLNRIFEPFFTTKQMNKGTGLGLAVVHGIIEQHDGFVSVKSNPGRGTTFSIYLPIVEPQGDRTDMGKKTVKTRPRTGTILLVEDEPDVLELAKTVLRQGNYQVLTAANGLEAVQVFQDHANEIDLVLMDMMMPKMNGPEARARMAKIRSGVPVLYCSGYSTDVLQSSFVPGEEQQVIHKPYHPEQLLERISLLLSRK